MILEKKEEIKLDLAFIPPELKPLAEEAQKFLELRNLYRAAIREINTKLEILDDEFQIKNDYNPIHHIESRVKSIQSTFEKVQRKNLEPTVEGLKSITDIAGIRVICNYIDDIHKIAGLLLKQDDIQLIREKDYIAKPKESGYSSLHIVVVVPVFLSDRTEKVPVEVQIRTIAMDTWASLEHELKYKRSGELGQEAAEELKKCAKLMRNIDERMQSIHKGL